MTCSKPTIENGSVSPNDTIKAGESYNVSCIDGYGLYGNTTIACDDNGTLSRAPNCAGLSRSLIFIIFSKLEEIIRAFSTSNFRPVIEMLKYSVGFRDGGRMRRRECYSF